MKNYFGLPNLLIKTLHLLQITHNIVGNVYATGRDGKEIVKIYKKDVP